MKLSPNAKHVWKRYSFNAMGWAVVFLGWWESPVGMDLKAAMGVKVALAIIAILLISGMIGSVIDQPSTKVKP